MNDDSREWATQGRRSWWSKHRSRVVVAALALALALGAWFAYENLDGFKALGRRDALGPSSESWFSSFPEEHGLVGADLIDGATRIRKELPSRDCFVVVKDGVIVHEEYYNGANLNSAFDVGGVGKVATVLAIGVAITRQDLTLDSNVKQLLDAGSEHGGDTPSFWNSNYWEQLSVRDLLAQVSSDGSYEPGAVFDDGDLYSNPDRTPLKFLNGVLRGATNQQPAAFVKKFLAEPLGLSDFFDHEGHENGEISFTGGQLASCRDVARFGQLIVNRGKWKMPDGRVRQLVSSSFIDEIAIPAFPAANRFYGLGGYVYNSRVSNEEVEPNAANAAASSLGSECRDVEGPVLAGDEPEFDVLFNTGALGSLMVTVPSQHTIIVSLGTTWASSSKCPAASKVVQQASLAESERTPLSRDNLFTARRVWKRLKSIVCTEHERKTLMKRSGLASRRGRGATYGNLWQSMHHKLEPASNVLASRLGQQDGNTYNDQMENLVNSVPQNQIDASKASSDALQPDATWTEDNTQRFSGTCTCSCAPNLDIGQCFNVRDSRSQNCDDLNLRSHGARFCPEIGIVNTCGDANTVQADEYGTSRKYTSENISAMIQGHSGVLNIINKQINPTIQDPADVKRSVFTCHVDQGCGEDRPGNYWNHKEGKYGNDLYALKCEPTGFSQCVFQADAKCAFENVKTPLTNVSVVQGETEALVEMPTSGWILKTEETSDASAVGVDPSYVRLNVPGHRQEKVQLLADSEQAYFVFDVVFGFAVVVFGVLVVAIAKGKFFSSRDGAEEPLLVSEEQKYDAENV